MQAIFQQLSRFGMVGIVNTAVAVSLQWAGWKFAGLSVAEAGYAAYAVAIAVSYFLNRTWTFDNRASMRKTLLPFVGQSLLSAIIYAQLTGYLAGKMPYMLAILIGVVAIFILNFSMARLIFKSAPAAL
jgi:putative flippase GtrA